MVAVRVLLTVPDVQPVVQSALTLMSPQPAGVGQAILPTVPAEVTVDPDFPAVPIHHQAASQLLTMGAQPDQIGHGSYVVRGLIDHNDIDRLARATMTPVGEPRLFSDPGIGLTPNPTCGGDPPVGTSLDVRRLLGVGRLRRLGMTGRGTGVAVVDNGINLPYLRQRGLRPRMSVQASWSPTPSISPGAAPVDHGTMCAYDIMLSAPDATLLDFSVLRTTRRGGSVMDGVLSDAVQAYSKLLQLMLLPEEERIFHSLVISNSWGMFHPSWDFPPGNPGRYADNANHPFNVIVHSLSSAGADIVFAAGNCGPACPDGRCFPLVPNVLTITGANSHSDVICVAGVDTNRSVVGYSSLGPGTLFHDKPDIAAYTHFLGSEAFGRGQPDSGTSAACPVMAGVVAAVRSVYPYDPNNPNRTPTNIKQFFNQNALNPGGAPGWRNDVGNGIVDTAALEPAPPALI
jgi:hypothetical protein